MMDWEHLSLVLQDLSASIQHVASAPSNFVLHRTQCCCLARSYTLAVDHVLQLHRTLSVRADLNASRNLVLPSVSELHHAMLQAHKFMQDCTFQDGWIRKALVLALTSEAQDGYLHDLVWCLCVIRQALCQLPADAISRSQDDVFSTMNAIWAETSPNDDCETLINALKHDIACWEQQLCQSEEVKAQLCLARFLLQKLLSETNVRNADSPYNTLLECFWVDPLQFTIKEAIGHGTYAVVYEVEWCGQRFGQKEFFGVDESFFGKEAAIQARLRHPNVLQLICCTSKPSRNKCSLVTELMDMDLRTAIDNRCRSGFDPPFSILTSVDLMLQIAKGMEYLHGLHIMHRDLKSQNLLVNNHVSTDRAQDGGRMRVKIADFGMSKAKCMSSRFTTMHAGTTFWRAPEVFKVDGHRELERKYTKKADVYSFAMVCFEILTGEVPFDDGGKLAKLHKRLLRGERPILPISCPQYLASYIERCWHINPEKRPSFTQISRTLRHLKGILLMSKSPFFSAALTGRSSTIIEDRLERTIGANWVSAASTGLTTRAITIAFEMFWYNVVERKLTEQVEPAAKFKQSTKSFRDLLSKGVCYFMWPLGRCVRQEQCAMDINTVKHYQLFIRQFSYKELYRATKCFSSLIGEGGFSSVFKGTLADGQVVAVKCLSTSKKQFETELGLLARIRHKNIVPFLGFCCENDHRLLVHKFMPGGDLESLSFRSGIGLAWAQKYNIVCGLASALNFLHNDCSPPILHRDVKPSNILLDENQEACLADFGIAILHSNSETHETTMWGTYTYMAPEYVTTLTLGPEADVFSFGIVVLELACGRRCIRGDTTNFFEYVWMHYQHNRLLDAVDESIGREGQHYNEEEMLRLLHLGLACTQSNPRHRPPMNKVVRILSKEEEAPIPVCPPHYLGLEYAEVHAAEGQHPL